MEIPLWKKGVEDARRATDGSRRILLLDMGMKRIQVYAAIGMVHLIDEAYGLIQRVQVIDLESVDDFFGQQHARVGSVLGHAAQVPDAACPLLGGRPSPGEDAQGYLMRTAQQR